MQVDGLLGVVDEVLHEEWQHFRRGVLLVVLSDGLAGAPLVELCHQTVAVAHLGEQLRSLCLAASFVESPCIDVLHHILIDGVDKSLGSLLPVGDVLLVAAQHHVAAHVEQGVLRAEPALGLAEGVGSDGLQVSLLLGYLLLRGIVPLILLLLLCVHAVEILRQVLHILHHECVALLACGLDDVVGIEPEILIVAAEIGLPVVVADALCVLAELQVVVGTEQVGVVAVEPCACPARQRGGRQQANDDKSPHRFPVYIC